MGSAYSYQNSLPAEDVAFVKDKEWPKMFKAWRF